MSRLSIATPNKAQLTVERLYKDLAEDKAVRHGTLERWSVNANMKL